MLLRLLVVSLLAITGVACSHDFLVDHRYHRDGVIYETYLNYRYGFVVDYPVGLLLPQPPPGNNDGRTFLSPDRRVRLIVWGSHFPTSDAAVTGEIPGIREWFEAELAAAPPTTYQVLREQAGWFVISGYDGDEIYYRKGIAAPDVCGFLRLDLRYPAAQAELYDAMTTIMSHSFTCVQ